VARDLAAYGVQPDPGAKYPDGSLSAAFLQKQRRGRAHVLLVNRGTFELRETPWIEIGLKASKMLGIRMSDIRRDPDEASNAE
jgi:hypothetical protein